MSYENAFSSDEAQLVTFIVGQESFGLDIMDVQEVIRMPEITTVPQSQTFIQGITNLRGHILPIIDTRTKFGLKKGEINESSRVIVVDIGGKAVGLNVDSVSEVLRVERQNIEDTPPNLSENVDSNSIAGVVKLDGGKKLVMVLDAPSLFGLEGINESSFNIKTQGENGEVLQDEMQIVSFLVGREEFGLEIDKVKEIIRFPEIVKVPNVPDYIKGIISLRDSLMPIIDLRTKLGTGADEVTGSTRVVIVDVSGTFVGLTVDQVYEVIRIPRDNIFPPPQAILSETGEKITGIARLDGGKRIIMLMDTENIINREVLNEITSGEAAGEAEEEVSIGDEKQLVVFKLGEEQYGVSIAQVNEITKMAQITKVPRSPQFVQGVVNLRGDVIPVIDMRTWFDMDVKDYTDRTRIIVSEMNSQKIGLIVDEVLEVLRISGHKLDEVPDIVDNQQGPGCMEGIVNAKDRIIMALKLENILGNKEWKQLRKISEQADKKAPAKSKRPKITG